MKCFVLLFPILSLVSCQGKKSKDSYRKPYPLLIVVSGDATLVTHYPCVIKGKQIVDIRPQVSGLITDICVDESAIVRKSDVLLSLTPKT